MPDTPETILAFDYGLRRIGIAVGQQVTQSASPLGVVANGTAGPDWSRIAALLDEWRPARLVVGMPWHADGSRSETTDLVESFIAELRRFDVEVDTIDERYTSLEATRRLKNARSGGARGRISKEKIDSSAASLIAERWLKNQP